MAIVQTVAIMVASTPQLPRYSRDGITLSGPRAIWGHGFVQSQFVGQLINRRKVYPASLRDVLARNLILRHTAVYTIEPVTGT
jgi:hypothetical protein